MFEEDKSVVDERKIIEQTIVNQLVRRDCIHRLIAVPRSVDGRLLSYSPFEARRKTTLPIHCFLRYKYSALSKEIHYCEDERASIQEQIEKILPLRYDKPPHLIFEMWNTEKSILSYCNEMRCNMPSKKNIERLRKLIVQWRLASQELHYRYTKQEKRKLKKKERNDNTFYANNYSEFVRDFAEEY